MPKMVPILSITLAVVLELTDRVDVKEAHGCREYGFEHAVVQRLRRLHQHVEQGEVPGEAENDGGSSQTWRDRRLLHTSEGAHSAHTHTQVQHVVTSINTQVEGGVQLCSGVQLTWGGSGVQAVWEGAVVAAQLLLLVGPEQSRYYQVT